MNEYKGTEYIDIRIFFQGSAGYLPSRKGLTIPTRLYNELLKGVLEVGGSLGEVDEQLLRVVDVTTPTSS